MIELAPNHKHGLPLRAPVMPAAGAFGYGSEYRDLVDYSLLGALVTNPVSLMPRESAVSQRLAVRKDQFLVHTGLPNPGLKAVIREYGRLWARLDLPVIVHLMATTPTETQRAAVQLSAVEGVQGIELGLVESVSRQRALRLLEAAMAGGLPIVVQVPFSRVQDLAMALVENGADALTLTSPPRGVLPVTEVLEAPVARYMRGRLYGAAVFPLLLNVLARWSKKVPAPVIACGGIASVADALACLSLGAAAVQIDALLWRDPGLLNAVALGLQQQYLDETGDEAEIGG